MGKKQFVEFPFTGGIDSKTEQAYLDPNTRLVQVQNGNFVKVGAIDKRAGIGFLGNTAAPASPLLSPSFGQRITAWSRSDITLMGSEGLYTLSTHGSAPVLNGVSPLPPCYPLRSPVPVAASLVTPIVVDGSYLETTLRMIITQDKSLSIYCTVVDGDGDVVFPNQEIYSSGSNFPFVVNALFFPNALATHQWVIFIQTGSVTSSQSLIALTYVPGTNVFSAPVTLYSAKNLPGFYVAPYINDTQSGYIVQWNYAFNTVELDYFLPGTTSPATSKTVTVPGGHSLTPFVSLLTVSSSNCCVATYGTGESIWACYVTIDVDNVYAWVTQFSPDHTFTHQADYSSLLSNSAQPFLTGACRLASNLLLTTYQESTNPGGSQGVNSFTGAWLEWEAGGSNPISFGTLPMGFVAQNQPFCVNGTAYQACIFNDKIQIHNEGTAITTEQATLYLMEISLTGATCPVATLAKNVVATASYGTLQLYTLNLLPLMSQQGLTATDFACGVNQVGIDTGAVSGTTGPSFVCDFFFDQPHQALLYQSQELGNELHISGAVPFCFDSQEAFEDNFFYFPEFSYAVNGYPGAGILPAGAYQYAVCYASTDASGLVHRSAPAYTDAITPSPQTPAVVTGQVNISDLTLYGPNGTLNLPVSVVGNKDVTQSALYGTNGTLGSPILIGWADITNSALYGVGGTLDGLALTIAVDTGFPVTYLADSFSESLPVTQIQSVSSIGFDSSGYLWVVTSGDPIVEYTGIVGALFTGTTGGTGTLGVTGTQIEQILDSGGAFKTTTLVLNGATNAASSTALLAAIHSKWSNLTAAIVDSKLVISSSSTGPTASLIIPTYADVTSMLGLPSGATGFAGNVLGLTGGQASPPYSIVATFNQSVPLVNVQGRSGAFSIAGSGFVFTDLSQSQFNSDHLGMPLFCTGSDNNSNNSGFTITTILSPNSVAVSPKGVNNPVADSTAKVAWAIFGNPPVRTLSLSVNGAIQKQVTLDPNTTASSQQSLFIAIESIWPNLYVSLDPLLMEYLSLTTTTTGSASSIEVWNDTANSLLGMTIGTTVGSVSNLIMTIDGNGPTAFPIDVTGNAAAGDQPATLLNSLTNFWTVTEATALTASLSQDGNNYLVLTTGAVGSSASINIASGYPNSYLGLTTGTTSGSAGTGGPVLHITNLSATYRQNVFCEIYRTTVNGSSFFLVDTVPIGTPTQTEIIWPITATSDITADSLIQSSTLLYTTGQPVGPLPNISPPSFLLQIVHNGRIAGVDETLQQVWFSQAFSSGTAPGFSGLLVVPFAEGGNITAIASMDGNFFCFKEDEIWIMSGNNGPALTGQGSDWTVPRRISTNVGAISQFGCVNTDVGIFFQANTGIYLLGRDIQVSFIGKNVIDTLAAFPTITSACLVPEATQVRFTCSDGSTNTTIVYDYLLQVWATHVYPYITVPIVSSCLDTQEQLYTLLDQSGNLWQENPRAAAFPWKDQDSSQNWHFVPTVVTTAWIKTSLQGYVRASYAQFLNQLQDPCGLQVQMAINYNPGIQQTWVYPYTQLQAAPLPGQIAPYLGAKFNQEMAYQYTISDVSSTDTVTGQGARFIGLGLMLENLGLVYPFLPIGSR